MSTISTPDSLRLSRRPGVPRLRASAAPVTRRELLLHGQRVTFLEAGADTDGPVVVLLHGLASSSQTWSSVLPLLGRHAHVIAPDLLGHGQSAKPPSGDYSLGAYAAGLRDLLVTLGLDRATIAGHSFGGGVAMQFAYQFPEMTERFYLLAEVPALLVGGSRDSIIPIEHTMAAHDLLPGSSLQIFEGAGHFPHAEQPTRFAQLLTRFLTNTTAARSDLQSLRRRLQSSASLQSSADVPLA
ncbi:hypothetical protein GCM10009609_55900 [Pseudonocardia aurantiaca]|uniref:Alpha/beta fold hydrolase n=1 Tax=Pseudonocardia aurantiaca TaxID=75290 RepID=A0ABW4FX70_9PSEU